MPWQSNSTLIVYTEKFRFRRDSIFVIRRVDTYLSARTADNEKDK